jgi:hypothetical protein
MNILEIFGVIFCVQIGILVITVSVSVVSGFLGKINTRKNYLDIMKLDGELRKKQADYFAAHPEEYEKWKKTQENANIKPGEKTEIKTEMPNQEQINDALKGAIQD